MEELNLFLKKNWTWLLLPGLYVVVLLVAVLLRFLYPNWENCSGIFIPFCLNIGDSIAVFASIPGAFIIGLLGIKIKIIDMFFIPSMMIIVAVNLFIYLSIGFIFSRILNFIKNIYSK